MSGRFVEVAVRALDRCAAALLPPSRRAAHLETGTRGEEDAYFYLRRQGYTVVARNWRTPRRHGEIDLIAWEGDTLCFVEVKTRSSRDFAPAEAAVDRAKREELAAVAREYLRRVEGAPPTRFDALSIYRENPNESADITLFKDAFTMS